MCGLVGGAGDFGPKANLVCTTMLEFDIIRGQDSTGVMIKDRKGCTIFKKESVPWYGLYYEQDFIDAADDVHKSVFLGHNRAATAGVVNEENAHPFNYKNIYGAHNGTLNANSKLDDYKSFDVDSQALFSHIAEKGIADAVSKASGAFALTWYDSEEGTMNFIRNAQRPLFFAYTSDQKTLFWASEEWMIRRACERAKLSIGDILPFAELQHYKILIPPSTGAWQERKFGKMRIKKLKPYVYVAPKQQSFRQGWPSRSTTQPFGHSPMNTNNIERLSHFKDKEVEESLPERFHRNQKVRFIVDSICRPAKVNPYIQAHLSADRSVSVQLSPVEGSKNWKMLIDDDVIAFTGNIKTVHDKYLLISLRTIKAASWMGGRSIVKNTDLIDDDEEEMFEVSYGKFVNREGWERMVKQGCGMCSDPIDIDEAGKLEWFNNEPICKSCSTDEIAC